MSVLDITESDTISDISRGTAFPLSAAAKNISAAALDIGDPGAP